jgi:hypothetical protein
MEKDHKLSLIHAYESAIDPLIEFTAAAPPQSLDFSPSLAGAWTIRDHAVHFLDADTFAYARIRLAVAQPGTEVFVWNEEVWQAKAKYETGQTLPALETSRALRQVVAAMARALVDDDWEGYYVRHPLRGRMVLADLLKLYTDHAAFHLSYFRRNLEAFAGSVATKT